jgi:hypothetical protein
MPTKDQLAFELLDFIGLAITKVLQEEGLLLPGTIDDMLRAKDKINKLKRIIFER